MRRATFEEIRGLALSNRTAGTLTLAYGELPCASDHPAQSADAFIASHGLKPIGKAWRIVDHLTALNSLCHILHCDLAYQRKLMEQKTARFIAENFLDLFSRHKSMYCANGEFDERGMLAWTPITTATFDLAVVAFDEKHIGFICAQDED